MKCRSAGFALVATIWLAACSAATPTVAPTPTPGPPTPTPAPPTISAAEFRDQATPICLAFAAKLHPSPDVAGGLADTTYRGAEAYVEAATDLESIVTGSGQQWVAPKDAQALAVAMRGAAAAAGQLEDAVAEQIDPGDGWLLTESGEVWGTTGGLLDIYATDIPPATGQAYLDALDTLRTAAVAAGLPDCAP